MMTRSKWGLAWLLSTGVALQGCVALRTPFETSAPQAIPPGVEGEVGPDGRTTLRLDGLDLRMETHNQRPRGVGLLWILPFPVVWPLPASAVFEDPNPQIPRQILFLDLRAGERGYAFNPMAVSVSNGHRSAAPPLAYVGPGRQALGGCRDSDGHDLARSTAATSYVIEPSEEEWTCFVIALGISSSPELPFRLVVAGLERNGERLPPMEFRFARATGRSWLVTPRTWMPESLLR